MSLSMSNTVLAEIAIFISGLDHSKAGSTVGVSGSGSATSHPTPHHWVSGSAVAALPTSVVTTIHSAPATSGR